MNIIYLSLIAFLSITSCNTSKKADKAATSVKTEKIDLQNEKYSKAYLASGCFWCVEAIFESVEGVAEVVSGYAGGDAKTANYSDVSSGRTRHAEAVEIYYDPSVVSFETLLKVFYGSHDPTTLNQQGPDKGPQYRSAVFYQNEEEKAKTVAYTKQLYQDGVFEEGSITTEVAPLDKFYPAEEYHQDFEKRNPNQGYVRAVSIPRLRKFQAKYPELLKKEKH